jgi:GT2 family glycosyltransferase
LISVCVPAYQPSAAGRLRRLADAVPAALGSCEGELVVVLNGVPHEVAPPGTTAVPLPQNVGVAAGWNAAARAASGNLLAFANDDVSLGAESLSALADVLIGHPDVGIVGPEAVSAGVLPAPDAGQLVGGGVVAEAVLGALLMVRRADYDAVGGFDEAYTPCLWEEIDFAYAVRSRLGLRCVAVPVAFDHQARISARRSWPWARVQFSGGSESLWSIRRRNRRRLEAKWGIVGRQAPHRPD